MARYPSGDWRPLPEWQSEPAITPRVVILHTMVGSLAGTDSHFRNSTSLEAHFGVGWNGQVWQWQDTGRQADANYRANDFAISVETEDGGDPSKPWTDAQLDAIVDLVGWCCDTHGIPRQLADRWDGTGIGWHAMWGAPSPWTPSAGKTCPGRVRIDQIRNVVMPRLTGAHTEEDDMPVTERSRVAYYQRILQSAGFDLGSAGADGIVGPKTSAAVNEWQSRRGLTQTGEFDLTTCMTLQSHANRTYAVEQAKQHAGGAHDHAGYAPEQHGHSAYAEDDHSHQAEVTLR